MKHLPPIEADVAAALDRLDVPQLPHGFADRLIAKAQQHPHAPLPPLRKATWQRRTVIAIAAASMVSAAAAATVAPDLLRKVPLVGELVDWFSPPEGLVAQPKVSKPGAKPTPPSPPTLPAQTDPADMGMQAEPAAQREAPLPVQSPPNIAPAPDGVPTPAQRGSARKLRLQAPVSPLIHPPVRSRDQPERGLPQSMEIQPTPESPDRNAEPAQAVNRTTANPPDGASGSEITGPTPPNDTSARTSSVRDNAPAPGTSTAQIRLRETREASVPRREPIRRPRQLEPAPRQRMRTR